jgi:hypothetical protein
MAPMTIHPRLLPTALAVIATATALLIAAPAALADSANLTVTTTGGQSDPVAGVPRIFTVSGTAAVSEQLFVKYRPAGGAPCAPSAYTDSGDSGSLPWWDSVNGAFSVSNAVTWRTTGTTLFCIWLAPDGYTISAPISQVVTFRAPTGTISATLNPIAPRPGQQAQVTITGASEAPNEVFAKVRPAGGAPCAPTFDSDSGTSLVNYQDVNGAFTVQATTTQDAPGSYLICLWLASSSYDASPIAGPQPATFSVVQPRPVVSSATLLNCRTGRGLRSGFHARRVASVCLGYRFSTAPLAGTKLSLTFVTPAHRTYSRVWSTWQENQAPTFTSGALFARAYKRQRGVWRAILRVAGKQVNVTSFRVR